MVLGSLPVEREEGHDVLTLPEGPVAAARIEQIQQFLHTALNVTDLAQAEHFYSEILGLTRVDGLRPTGGHRAIVRMIRQCIEKAVSF